MDTTWLKEHDYFCGYRSGGITWTYRWGSTSSINFSVDIMDNPHIQFKYVIDKGTEEEKDMDYVLKLGLKENNCSKIVEKTWSS